LPLLKERESMKGWMFHGAGKPLELIERADPSAGAGEVVIKVRAAGLCHSDVGRLEGTLGAGFLPKPPPLILGHEVAGEVIEAGAGVTGYKVGDRVVASGTTEFCPGRDADGGYATHLGMTAARIAVLNGAEVYGAEPRVEAWEAALQQGVKAVVAEVRELAPLKLDLIVDFAGFGDTTAGAVEAVRKGGMVVQVGLGRTEALISTAALIRNKVTLRGSSGGRPADTGSVIGHMAKGDLTIEASTIGFDDIPAGLDRLKRGGVIGRIVAAMD
jgi:propanol-preferring alcohol dehydrogenase